jgi:hypothetical protein
MLKNQPQFDGVPDTCILPVSEKTINFRYVDETPTLVKMQIS